LQWCTVGSFAVLTFLLTVTQYAEYEQVVVEDRIEKEKARRKVDQEAREIAAAVKVSVVFYFVFCKASNLFL